MKRINRLLNITKARIDAFLDTLDKPEIIFPQLLKELNEQINETGKAEAKALSAVKGDRRRLDAAIGKSQRYEEGAQLAVNAGDMETARQAVAAHMHSEKEVEECRRILEISESAYHTAMQVRRQLQDSLHELKLRKDEILTRAKTAQIKTNANAVLVGTDGILEAVARMEAGVETSESTVEIQSKLRQTLGASFPYERIKELESNAEVDRRLEELKKKIKPDPA